MFVAAGRNNPQCSGVIPSVYVIANDYNGSKVLVYSTKIEAAGDEHHLGVVEEL